MRRSLTLILILTALVANAQVYSQFTWNSGSITHADVGSDGTLATGATAVTLLSANGTLGVSPNGNDIDLLVPGTEFEHAGLDVSLDFIRAENTASFFTLGGMDYGINTGAMYAKFVLNNGGTLVPVSLNNLFAAPTDANFHNFRFVYDNVAGTFKAYLDGVLSYTRPVTTPGQPLDWSTATQATIGSGLNANGAHTAVLDNFIAQGTLTVLAVQLMSFDAAPANNANQLTWSATTSDDLSNYTIERSANGTNFTPIGTTTSDHFTDNAPLTISFYRLKLNLTDGSSTYSQVKKVTASTNGSGVSLTCYPNPVVNYANIRIDNATPATYRLTVATLDGRILRAGEIETANAGTQLSLDLTTAPHGIILVSLQTAGDEPKTFKIWKQ